MWKNLISEDLKVTDLIYRDPSGTNDEQARIYLEIDWVDHTVDVNTSLSMDRNSISMKEYHGRLTRIRLSNSVDARELREEIDGYLPVIEEIAKGYTEEWDGSNWIGYQSDETEIMLMDLGEKLQSNLSELDIGYTDAYDWYESEEDRDTIKTDIDSILDDESLSYIARGDKVKAYIADCEEEALRDGVVLYNLGRLIRDLREEDEE